MKNMKLDVRSLGLTLGVLGAIYMLILQFYPVLTEAVFSGNAYGGSMHFMMEDMYPFYKQSTGLIQALLGVLYGFVDGFIGGVVIAFVYNKFLGTK